MVRRRHRTVGLFIKIPEILARSIMPSTTAVAKKARSRGRYRDGTGISDVASQGKTAKCSTNTATIMPSAVRIVSNSDNFGSLAPVTHSETNNSAIILPSVPKPLCSDGVSIDAHNGAYAGISSSSTEIIFHGTAESLDKQNMATDPSADAANCGNSKSSSSDSAVVLSPAARQGDNMHRARISSSFDARNTGISDITKKVAKSAKAKPLGGVDADASTASANAVVVSYNAKPLILDGCGFGALQPAGHIVPPSSSAAAAAAFSAAPSCNPFISEPARHIESPLSSAAAAMLANALAAARSYSAIVNSFSGNTVSNTFADAVGLVSKAARTTKNIYSVAVPTAHVSTKVASNSRKSQSLAKVVSNSSKSRRLVSKKPSTSVLTCSAHTKSASAASKTVAAAAGAVSGVTATAAPSLPANAAVQAKDSVAGENSLNTDVDTIALTSLSVAADQSNSLSSAAVNFQEHRSVPLKCSSAAFKNMIKNFERLQLEPKKPKTAGSDAQSVPTATNRAVPNRLSCDTCDPWLNHSFCTPRSLTHPYTPATKTFLSRAGFSAVDLSRATPSVPSGYAVSSWARKCVCWMCTSRPTCTPQYDPWVSSHEYQGIPWSCRRDQSCMTPNVTRPVPLAHGSMPAVIFCSTSEDLGVDSSACYVSPERNIQERKPLNPTPGSAFQHWKGIRNLDSVGSSAGHVGTPTAVRDEMSAICRTGEEKEISVAVLSEKVNMQFSQQNDLSGRKQQQLHCRGTTDESAAAADAISSNENGKHASSIVNAQSRSAEAEEVNRNSKSTADQRQITSGKTCSVVETPVFSSVSTSTQLEDNTAAQSSNIYNNGGEELRCRSVRAGTAPFPRSYLPPQAAAAVAQGQWDSPCLSQPLYERSLPISQPMPLSFADALQAAEQGRIQRARIAMGAASAAGTWNKADIFRQLRACNTGDAKAADRRKVTLYFVTHCFLLYVIEADIIFVYNTDTFTGCIRSCAWRKNF